jgi:predicted ester cyclase
MGFLPTPGVSQFCIVTLLSKKAIQKGVSPMSAEENKALIRRSIEEFNQGNATEISPRVDEFFAPDFVLHDPNIQLPAGGIHNREDYKQFLSGFMAALPGQFTIEDLIAEGEKVVLRYTHHGTHQGSWRGVAPTGKAVTFTGTVTYHIVDGKVVEAWQNADNLSVLRQLGLLPT